MSNGWNQLLSVNMGQNRLELFCDQAKKRKDQSDLRCDSLAKTADLLGAELAASRAPGEQKALPIALSF